MKLCALCREPAHRTVDGELLCEHCADVSAAWLQKHGKAQKRTPAVVLPIRIGPRVCSRCKVEDHTIVREGQIDFAGRSILEHNVTEELRYIKDAKAITFWHKTRGWRFRPHLGRNAMVRLICRSCLNEASIMQKDLERKKRADVGGNDAGQYSYYLNLCGDL